MRRTPSLALAVVDNGLGIPTSPMQCASHKLMHDTHRISRAGVLWPPGRGNLIQSCEELNGKNVVGNGGRP